MNGIYLNYHCKTYFSVLKKFIYFCSCLFNRRCIYIYINFLRIANVSIIIYEKYFFMATFSHYYDNSFFILKIDKLYFSFTI
ncbi:hypothetical protein, partial [Plasmodium yoelii yoelii]